MDMEPLFRDRADAGRQLAARAGRYANRDDVRVLGLPRGGVPVAWELAHAWGCPLDAFVVRKLGIPGFEEMAMGAVAAGVRILDQELIRSLGIAATAVAAVAAREQRELERRERLYRAGRPPPEVRGLTVLLVDDGMATGSSMQVAAMALRLLRPAAVVVAVPVATAASLVRVGSGVDDVVCIATPEPFIAIGACYADFSQTEDAEVRRLLAEAESGRMAAPGGGAWR